MAITERLKSISVGKDESNTNSHTLIVRVWISAATLKTCFSEPAKLEGT